LFSFESSYGSVKQQIEEVNKLRKHEQTQKSTEIDSLQREWFELVYKNMQIEQACRTLEQQIHELEYAFIK